MPPRPATQVICPLSPPQVCYFSFLCSHMVYFHCFSEDSDQPRSSSNTESSHIDSSPDSDLSVRDGERTLRTLRNIRSSYNATQTASIFNSEISSYSDLMDSSSLPTPKLTSGMNLSLGGTDLSEAALTHSQAPSETTGKGLQALL